MARVLAIVEKLDTDHIRDTVAAEALANDRAARRQKWGDLTKAFGLIGTILGIALAVMALWRGAGGG